MEGRCRIHMNNRYDEIINLPHHVSKTRPQMPMSDRAAQFAPFAALTGYDAAIKETGRLTDERIELDVEALSTLDMFSFILFSICASYCTLSIKRNPFAAAQGCAERTFIFILSSVFLFLRGAQKKRKPSLPDGFLFFCLYSSSITAISAASPRRGPVRTTRV